MKRRRKTSSAPAPMPPAATVAKIGVARVTGWKLWSFRALAAFGVPLVLLGLLELVLRVTGYGHPTGFFKAERHNGREILVQNNQFGWRFFGPEMARRPNPLAISPAPAGNTVRIVVLGESAAKGDPDPHFGLPRMLEATLSLRHPGMRFEVINAAMTAINSHAVRLIARDCVPLKSDLWVIYMGNNEVVGPFGAGTVFGPQSPPLALVRSALALQTTRTGQWLDAGIQWARKSRYESPEWGGMEMFLDQQVPADDPRMGGVYHHFERNLSDILDVARSAGVGVVVSTVAVNLKDCAPFASAHRADLSAGGRARWEEEYQLGVAAQRAGNTQEAAQRFQAAAQIDDSFAELRFRLGQCALARGEVAAARVEFRAARDLDTLRFRCDSRLNTLARKVVSDRGEQRVVLADAGAAFAAQSPDELPGENFFYEHVHLTFEGNHLLARVIGEQVERLLAPRFSTNNSTNRVWPSAEECARRLGWTDWSRLTGWKGVLPRLRHPPFTGQFDSDPRLQL